MGELEKLRLFTRLVSANFSNEGLACLASLRQLNYLRRKDNRQLTNECIDHVLRLDALVELQIHGPSINQRGLDDSMRS